MVEQPLSLVGGIRSLEDIERVLEDGIDMVSMSRAVVSEPDM
ncbi:HisA/HisF-related TIM barrel protein [Schwartzia sp. (in: firmicutes)]